ncbi:hypothetical protein [Paracoccus sp. MKU1]|uniref:hypothetical protein n=1 Tax=Paracoccus sp. MKU1 TaxID=1745182 RepID=UPI000719362D|nr:hypothetical protein [Paracoccus sp. MKU1]KRW95878.1 hypothetical protein AQY21_12030 [Paracoccus sp. MKU1]
MRPERLHQDDRHRITLFRGTGDGRRAVVGFEHGRDRMTGFEPAAAPRFAARLGIDALVVQTARRDWFVSDRSAALAEALQEATRDYAEVTATGFSMGGYAALLYSAACHASRVMAVSPQYCIDPAVAPFDPGRHGKFSRIGLPMPRPETLGNRGVRGALIYDPTIRADRAHVALIRTGFPHLTPIALPFGGHPATGVIGAAGGTGRIAGMVVQDRLDAALVRQMHRAARRKAELYRLNLAAAALPRHPARALCELRALASGASPRICLEAGLILLERGEDLAVALLSELLDSFEAVPPALARRLDRALKSGGI